MSKPIIQVENLHKTFKHIQKSPGFFASVSSFLNPVYREKIAVDYVTFNISQGECLAFIGPNGAGKSTTIKIMTGILHATSGNVSILGLDPVKDRTRLAFNIGTVFGQKSQLWYHLPPFDTYNLLSHIYELNPIHYKDRLAFLTKKFDIEHLLTIPVRKLSLGERMRCELVGSLLHRPKILFLDEPTIGLDVVAKQQVRHLLEYLNKEEGVTIFLTSHDVGDIEKLTQRTIIINYGSVIFDDSTENLKKQFITSKIIEIIFEEQSDPFVFDQGKIIERKKNAVKIQLDTSIAATQALLEYALKNFTIVDIAIYDTPLEQILARIYEDEFS